MPSDDEIKVQEETTVSEEGKTAAEVEEQKEPPFIPDPNDTTLYDQLDESFKQLKTQTININTLFDPEIRKLNSSDPKYQAERERIKDSLDYVMYDSMDSLVRNKRADNLDDMMDTYRGVMALWMLGSIEGMTIQKIQQMDPKELRETYMPMFEKTIRENSMSMKPYKDDPKYSASLEKSEAEREKANEAYRQKRDENSAYWGQVMANAYAKMSKVKIVAPGELKSIDDVTNTLGSETGFVLGVSTHLRSFMASGSLYGGHKFKDTFEKRGRELTKPEGDAANMGTFGKHMSATSGFMDRLRIAESYNEALYSFYSSEDYLQATMQKLALENQFSPSVNGKTLETLGKAKSYKGKETEARNDRKLAEKMIVQRDSKSYKKYMELPDDQKLTKSELDKLNKTNLATLRQEDHKLYMKTIIALDTLFEGSMLVIRDEIAAYRNKMEELRQAEEQKRAEQEKLERKNRWEEELKKRDEIIRKAMEEDRKEREHIERLMIKQCQERVDKVNIETKTALTSLNNTWHDIPEMDKRMNGDIATKENGYIDISKVVDPVHLFSHYDIEFYPLQKAQEDAIDHNPGSGWMTDQYCGKGFYYQFSVTDPEHPDKMIGMKEYLDNMNIANHIYDRNHDSSEYIGAVFTYAALHPDKMKIAFTPLKAEKGEKLYDSNFMTIKVSKEKQEPVPINLMDARTFSKTKAEEDKQKMLEERRQRQKEYHEAVQEHLKAVQMNEVHDYWNMTAKENVKAKENKLKFEEKMNSELSEIQEREEKEQITLDEETRRLQEQKEKEFKEYQKEQAERIKAHRDELRAEMDKLKELKTKIGKMIEEAEQKALDMDEKSQREAVELDKQINKMLLEDVKKHKENLKKIEILDYQSYDYQKTEIKNLKADAKIDSKKMEELKTKAIGEALKSVQEKQDEKEKQDAQAYEKNKEEAEEQRKKEAEEQRKIEEEKRRKQEEEERKKKIQELKDQQKREAEKQRKIDEKQKELENLKRELEQKEKNIQEQEKELDKNEEIIKNAKAGDKIIEVPQHPDKADENALKGEKEPEIKRTNTIDRLNLEAEKLNQSLDRISIGKDQDLEGLNNFGGADNDQLNNEFETMKKSMAGLNKKNWFGTGSVSHELQRIKDLNERLISVTETLNSQYTLGYDVAKAEKLRTSLVTKLKEACEDYMAEKKKGRWKDTSKEDWRPNTPAGRRRYEAAMAIANTCNQYLETAKELGKLPKQEPTLSDSVIDPLNPKDWLDQLKSISGKKAPGNVKKVTEEVKNCVLGYLTAKSVQMALKNAKPDDVSFEHAMASVTFDENAENIKKSAGFQKLVEGLTDNNWEQTYKFGQKALSHDGATIFSEYIKGFTEKKKVTENDKKQTVKDRIKAINDKIAAEKQGMIKTKPKTKADIKENMGNAYQEDNVKGKVEHIQRGINKK